MSVSVAILNWNGEEYLRKFLPSVVRYSPGAEIVVIDNASTDSSVEFLAREYPGIRLVLLERNYGYAGGYNLGMQQIHTDYTVLLNSDVEVTERWLEPLLDEMEKNLDTAAVQPKILSWNERVKFEYAGAAGGFIDCLGYPFCRGRIISTTETDHGQYDDPREIFWATGACLMVRTDLFLASGGFAGSFFAHMEEIDLCWRLRKYGYRIMARPDSTVYHVGGGTLDSQSPFKLYLNYRNNLFMLYRNLSVPYPSAVITLRMVADGLSALVYLITGQKESFKAVWQAHKDYFRNRARLKAERSEIKKRSVRKAGMIYRGSVVMRYFMGKKTFGKMM